MRFATIFSIVGMAAFAQEGIQDAATDLIGDLPEAVGMTTEPVEEGSTVAETAEIEEESAVATEPASELPGDELTQRNQRNLGRHKWGGHRGGFYGVGIPYAAYGYPYAGYGLGGYGLGYGGYGAYGGLGGFGGFGGYW